MLLVMGMINIAMCFNLRSSRKFRNQYLNEIQLQKSCNHCELLHDLLAPEALVSKSYHDLVKPVKSQGDPKPLEKCT